MTTYTAEHCTWFQRLKHAFASLFGATKAPRCEDVRPTPSEEELDQAIEDTFPASDPPSYTPTSNKH